MSKDCIIILKGEFAHLFLLYKVFIEKEYYGYCCRTLGINMEYSN